LGRRCRDKRILLIIPLAGENEWAFVVKSQEFWENSFADLLGVATASVA